MEQTSPSRWVWHNPYGVDEDRIKDFLRSLRYRADWDPSDAQQRRERAVSVTMHVGEDSTSSWTVYQLEQSEVYAGRDTLVEYCPNVASLDLRSYLSAEVDPEAGYFSPQPSDREHTFVPGTDEDGDYLYIVEQEDCRDTAVITLRVAGQDHLGLDTVVLCPGGRERIGFPPGKYTSVTWWDGSNGDSIWVAETMDVQRRVEVDFMGCGISVPVEIIIRPVEGLAGADTVLTFCAQGVPVVLPVPPSPPGGHGRIEPSLASGGLEFTPGMDAPGAYHYIVTTDVAGQGCADTARITVEESETAVLRLEDVTLCPGTEARIGLPPGRYSEVIWWNGDRGDSTTLAAADAGPYEVEARVDGCTYQGQVMVTLAEEVVIPQAYASEWTLCGETPEVIVETGLDSVEWDGRIYSTGEELSITTAGEYLLRGYAGDCVAEKDISVRVMADPSGEYGQTIAWCCSQPIPLTLPDDNAQWEFRWADGTVDRERLIDNRGSYGLLIEAERCVFEAIYEVVEDHDCGEECTLSIPNAVSPNGDGVNEDLRLYAPGCTSIRSVVLLDKWGSVLYRTEGMANGTSVLIPAEVWQPLAPGVYVVSVEYEDGRGRIKSEWGVVTVVR